MSDPTPARTPDHAPDAARLGESFDQFEAEDIGQAEVDHSDIRAEIQLALPGFGAGCGEFDLHAGLEQD